MYFPAEAGEAGHLNWVDCPEMVPLLGPLPAMAGEVGALGAHVVCHVSPEFEILPSLSMAGVAGKAVSSPSLRVFRNRFLTSRSECSPLV